MYAWTPFPFVRLAGAAIAGILLYEAVPQWWDDPVFLIILAFSFLGLMLLSRIVKYSLLSLLTGITGLLLIAGLFGQVASMKKPLNDPSHWRNIDERIEAFDAVIVSDVLEKSRTRRFTARLAQVVTKSGEIKPVTGQVFLYIKKDSLFNPDIRYGHRVRMLATPVEIPPPSNPREFNYSNYVARQYVFGQCFVQPEHVKILDYDPENILLATAYKIREDLRGKILLFVPNERSQAIALALLIGVKDYLDDELKTAYASAGAMHVLAVSGLHVGVLYVILLFFLKPLEKNHKGKLLAAFISITVIWFYTFVTGMSPSVLRAATMFSIMATSRAVSRNSSIFNSLGLSAFVLLLFDPNLLFSVGFQLSFVAVAGIAYMQPRIYSLMLFRHYLVDKIWMITAVSIAAQVATFPMSLFYFNQFPTYFLLSNLVVIPGATLIMISGIAMLVTGSFAVQIGKLLGWIVNGLIYGMNFMVDKIEKIPGSLVTWLYFDTPEVVMVYVVIVMVLIGLHFNSYKHLVLAGCSLLVLFGWNHHRHWQQSGKDMMVIYEITGATAIDWIQGRNAQLFVDDPSGVSFEMLRFQIDPNRLAMGLPPFTETLAIFDSVIIGETTLYLAQMGNFRIIQMNERLKEIEVDAPIEADVLIINGKAIADVKTFLSQFKVSQVIIGTENPRYYANWLKEEMTKENIPVHSLELDGSWQVEL
jgi:competence protein ComEC